MLKWKLCFIEENQELFEEKRNYFYKNIYRDILNELNILSRKFCIFVLCIQCISTYWIPSTILKILILIIIIIIKSLRLSFTIRP